MTDYEALLSCAEANEITVYERFDLSGTRIRGLYCDGVVALSRDLMLEAERRCILAEEIDHHMTTSGDIIDQTDVLNRKQELRARAWAYRELLPPSLLLDAERHGCRNRYEVAEYAGVTEDFLEDAMLYYMSHPWQ